MFNIHFELDWCKHIPLRNEVFYGCGKRNNKLLLQAKTKRVIGNKSSSILKGFYFVLYFFNTLQPNNYYKHEIWTSNKS